MKSLRSKHLVLLITLMILKLLSTECRNPVLHRVGGARTLGDPALTSLIGRLGRDSLLVIGFVSDFGFDKWTHNVLEVNKTCYENCEEKDFLTNVTRGGRDVFNLTEAKVYYFSCGKGFCSEGMKIEIPVWLWYPLLFPPPDDDVRQYNGFPPYTYGSSGKIILNAMLASALACILLLL